MYMIGVGRSNNGVRKMPYYSQEDESICLQNNAL